MTPEEKNNYELELVKLKAKFISIGITKMPVSEIQNLMPSTLTASEAIKWMNDAKGVWHTRNIKYETFLPIFEKVYNMLKDIVKIDD